jgi:uncharacterized protein (DUF1330 family)
MAVYLIVGYDITDPKGYEGYVPGVVPLLQKRGPHGYASFRITINSTFQD